MYALQPPLTLAKHLPAFPSSDSAGRLRFLALAAKDPVRIPTSAIGRPPQAASRAIIFAVQAPIADAGQLPRVASQYDRPSTFTGQLFI
jgi:hypothetical protein